MSKRNFNKRWLIIILSFFFPCLLYAQTRPFNKGWKFIGLDLTREIQKIDSSRKLGKNWNDQFIIEKVYKADTLLLQKSRSLENELGNLEGRTWENVTLPHIAFPEPLVIVKPREGIAYYKKTFFVDRILKGKRLTLEFEAAMQVTDVWFNGIFVQQHLGGYLPFTIDISDLANYGADNTIVLKINNKANPTVPPGKPVDKLDFIYYSGIYRDVWFHITNPLHITDALVADKQAGGGIFVTYRNVSKKQATVNIQTHIINEGSRSRKFTLVQNMVDKTGKVAGTSTSGSIVINAHSDRHFVQTITLKNPALWHPDHPDLYQLQTAVKEGNTITDEKNTRIGIRSFAVSKETGLLINGEPFHIAGTNRHQNYPYIGNALSNNASYRDAFLIKEAGMNCVRSAHYPPDPSFLDAADELGILIVDCIPGWQFFNKAASFSENVMKDIRQMIRRDRNHSCIVLWEVSLNETYPSAEFRCRQNEVAKKEWIGTENFYTSGDSYFTKACWDVPYDDWNGDPGARNNTTYPDHAFLMREYGDYEFGGGESTSRQLRGAGEKALLQQAWNHQWEHNKNVKAYPQAIGDLTWAFYDGLAGCTTGIEGWGSADIFRIPKFSYYFFQSQRPCIINNNLRTSGGPMVYIANYWTERTSPANVVVYSNCEEVALYLNNEFIARQKPDQGPDTPYGTESEKGGKPFDGGNANYLTHPPFTFTGLNYKKGTLKAVGLIRGKPLASCSVSTPGTASAIELQAGYAGKSLKADGADAVFVYARIVDNKKNSVMAATNRITLSLKGDAKIASPVSVDAEAGIASFLLQAGTKAGSIILSATSAGIQTGTLTIVSK